MVSLVIFLIHGSALDLKVVSKSTIGDSSIVTIGVYYNLALAEDVPVEINGSPDIKRMLADKDDWFDDALPGRLSLLKQLFDRVMAANDFEPSQIYFYAEGNLGVRGGDFLTPVIIEMMDYIQPGTAVLPTGNPTCCKFIHYWMNYHNYPPLPLGEKFIVKDDYYSTQELTLEKRAELDLLVAALPLKGPVVPFVATFDKQRITESIKLLLGIRSAVASPAPPPSLMVTPNGRLSPFMEDNNVYSFSENESERSLILFSSSNAIAISESALGLLFCDDDSDLDCINFSRTISTSDTFHETPGSTRHSSQEQDDGTEETTGQGSALVEKVPHLAGIPEHTALFRPTREEDTYRLERAGSNIPQQHLSGAQTQSVGEPIVEIALKETKLKPVPKPQKKRGCFFFSCCYDDATAVKPLPIVLKTFPHSDASQQQDGDNTREGTHQLGV